MYIALSFRHKPARITDASYRSGVNFLSGVEPDLEVTMTYSPSSPYQLNILATVRSTIESLPFVAGSVKVRLIILLFRIPVSLRLSSSARRVDLLSSKEGSTFFNTTLAIHLMRDPDMAFVV